MIFPAGRFEKRPAVFLFENAFVSESVGLRSARSTLWLKTFFSFYPRFRVHKLI